jgi:hypothetical protein
VPGTLHESFYIFKNTTHDNKFKKYLPYAILPLQIIPVSWLNRAIPDTILASVDVGQLGGSSSGRTLAVTSKLSRQK